MNERCKQIIESCDITRGLVPVFEDMEKEVSKDDITLVITLYDGECNLKSGDLAPELHLVLRRVV